MAKKNDFEVFCDFLEISHNRPNPDNSNGDELKYVRVNLENKSTDYLIQIKAEAEEDDIQGYNSNRIALLAFMVSVIFPISELLQKILSDMPKEKMFDYYAKWGMTFLIFGLLLYIAYCAINILRNRNQFSSVIKWRKYILAVIDDLIEKSKKNEQVYEIEVEEISSHKKSTYIGKIQKI